MHLLCSGRKYFAVAGAYVEDLDVDVLAGFWGGLPQVRVGGVIALVAVSHKRYGG